MDAKAGRFCMSAHLMCLFKAKPVWPLCYDFNLHIFDGLAMKCHILSATVVALLCSSPVFAAEVEAQNTVSQPAQPVSYRCLKPDYPKAAIALNQEGVVEISWAVDEAGKTTAAWVATSSGSDLLDHAALRSAKKCQFQPKIEDGKAVPARYVQPFHFRLRPSAS